MAFSTVLLDLDGTITNPYMGITNGVMYAYEHLGLEVPPRESLRSFIGPPLIVEFTRRGMPEEQAQEAVRAFRRHFAGFPQASRIAVVTESAIARMQVRREMTQPYLRIFARAESALAWLLRR